MKRTLLAFIIAFIPWLTVSSELNQEAAEKLLNAYCSRSAIEVEINKDLFEVAMYSDILVKLLSGNTQKALEQLGSELSMKVTSLYSQIKKNPCNAKKEELAKIYPMLRVVAAINEKTPIPGLNQNQEVMDILRLAINDNPKHYKETQDRAKEWDNGIK